MARGESTGPTPFSTFHFHPHHGWPYWMAVKVLLLSERTDSGRHSKVARSVDGGFVSLALKYCRRLHVQRVQNCYDPAFS